MLAQYLARLALPSVGHGLPQPLDRRSQAPLLRQCLEPLRIGRGKRQVGGGVLNRDIGDDINYGRRHIQIGGGVTQALELGGGEAGIGGAYRGAQAGQATEFLEEADSCFFAHTRDAGEAVGGVAAQDCHFAVLGTGSDAVALGQPRLVDDVDIRNPAPQIQDSHTVRVINKLEEVAVAGYHVYGGFGFDCAGGQSADDVVGFVAVHPDARDADRGQDLFDDLDLGGEGVRDFFAARLRIYTVRLIGR